MIMRRGNLPIVDLSKSLTDGKEAHYIHINQLVGRLTENKKTDRREHKESRIQFHARFENSHLKNGK